MRHGSSARPARPRTGRRRARGGRGGDDDAGAVQQGDGHRRYLPPSPQCCRWRSPPAPLSSHTPSVIVNVELGFRNPKSASTGPLPRAGSGTEQREGRGGVAGQRDLTRVHRDHVVENAVGCDAAEQVGASQARSPSSPPLRAVRQPVTVGVLIQLDGDAGEPRLTRIAQLIVVRVHPAVVAGVGPVDVEGVADGVRGLGQACRGRPPVICTKSPVSGATSMNV